MTDDLEVSGLNMPARLATFTDGTSGPITDMFDDQGDDTSDPDLAVAVIVEHKTTGRWFVEIPDEFEPSALQ